MSAPNLAQAERQLSAGVRQFSTVKGAVLWYVEQRAARTGRAINLETMRLPRSQAEVERSQATFARLADCLAPTHAADDAERYPEPLPDDHLVLYVAWASGVRSQTYLADEAGIGLASLTSWMHSTERRLLARLRDRGLLDGEEEPEARRPAPAVEVLPEGSTLVVSMPVVPAAKPVRSCFVDCPHEPGTCPAALRSSVAAMLVRNSQAAARRLVADVREGERLLAQDKRALRSVVRFLRWGAR